MKSHVYASMEAEHMHVPLQSRGHKASGDCHLSAAVSARAVFLPVLRGGLPPPQYPQSLPAAACPQCLAQAASALREASGRAQDMSSCRITRRSTWESVAALERWVMDPRNT